MKTVQDLFQLIRELACNCTILLFLRIMKTPRRSAIMKLFMVFKRVCQFLFYIIFLWSSFYSVKEFVEGKVVYNIIKTKADELKFPDLTLCPRQENSLAYLKTKNLRKDFNLDPADIEAAKIFPLISKNSSILDNYSFTDKESILKNKFR